MLADWKAFGGFFNLRRQEAAGRLGRIGHDLSGIGPLRRGSGGLAPGMSRWPISCASGQVHRDEKTTRSRAVASNYARPAAAGREADRSSEAPR
jgi:hypothetical protein